MVEFSQRLKQLRKEKHLTQAQVAERIGVTASMVSSYETDIRLPSYEVLVVNFGVQAAGARTFSRTISEF